MTSPTPTATPAASPPSASPPTPPRAHAPPLGSRIQVLWSIDQSPDSPEPPPPLERWWGAVVQDCTTDTSSLSIPAAHAGKPVHILLYDAFGEFDEDIAHVIFLPDRSLVDLARIEEETDGILDWRLETEGDEYGYGARGNGGELSLMEVVDAQVEMVSAAGISANADLEALREYPPSVQIGVASGYRVFADGVKQMLGELVASKPMGYVVTEEDVQSVVTRIRERSE